MNCDPNSCHHLTVGQVMEIHATAITMFGGSDGLREPMLLESAVAAPQASFGGVSTFSDTVEVAAAYLYYLCSNHPFIDGNKRVALGAGLVFLQINGYQTAPDSEGLGKPHPGGGRKLAVPRGDHRDFAEVARMTAQQRFETPPNLNSPYGTCRSHWNWKSRPCSRP